MFVVTSHLALTAGGTAASDKLSTLWQRSHITHITHFVLGRNIVLFFVFSFFLINYFWNLLALQSDFVTCTSVCLFYGLLNKIMTNNV